MIPCYNQAQYLDTAIQSVFSQTYKNFEIIVVNDGSTDQSAEIAARYAEVRCVSQNNQGQAAARNRGVRESKGQFLVFLDADDLLLPNALDAGLRRLRERPECAFTFGKCRIISWDGSEIPTWPQPLFENNHYRELLIDNYIFTTARVLHRRSAIEQVGGFNRNVVPAEDYDLYLRISRIIPICSHNELVAEYRRHANQISLNSAIMLKATTMTLRSQKRYTRGNQEYKDAYQKGMRHWQQKYGEPLIYQIRSRFRKPKQWNRVFTSIRTLIRYSPEFVARRLFRKIQL